MWWLWLVLMGLAIAGIAVQVGYIRGTAELRGGRVATVIRAVNIGLLVLALGIASYGVYVSLAAKGG